MTFPSPRLRPLLVATAAFAFTAPLWASDARTDTPQQERAACAAMTDPTARTSCLRDLGAARQQAQRQGPAKRPSTEQLRQNALKRCDAHTGLEERAICVRMISGDGAVSGSVSGGGLLRELETPIPNPTQ